MKNKLLLTLAAGSLVCASCSNDELENNLVEAVGKKVVITATIEGQGDETRSTVTDEGKFDWAEGDKMNVYTTNSTWKEFAYSVENKFEGTLAEEEQTSIWAVYPNMTASNEDETYSVSLPATYELGENTNNTNAPMVAWFSEGATDFEFKHLGGVIRFTLTNVPVGASKFVLTVSGQKINGTFNLSKQDDENYIIATESTESTDVSSTTLTFSTVTESKDMTFYVPLPTGEYSSMTFSLKDDADNVLFTKASSKAKTITRRKLLMMNPIEATAVVSTEEELKTAVEAGGYIKLSADVTLTSTLVIGENVTVTLDLNGKTINNTTDLYSTTNKTWSLISVQGGTLAIDNGTLQAKNGDCFAIDVKDGGKLVVNGGEYVGNISSVYCHTGEVEINGGTFRVQQTSENSGGPYSETLNCYDANYKTGSAKITVKGGSFYQFNPVVENSDASNAHSYVAEGYTSFKDGDYYKVLEGTVVGAQAELQAALNAGGNVKLSADITLTSPLVIGSSVTVTLDLNGKTISNTDDLWKEDETEGGDWSLISVQGGTLTIDNGTLKAKENDCYAIDVRDGGKLVINGGTYVGNICSVYCLAGEVEINNGQFSVQQVLNTNPYSSTLNCLDANYNTGSAKITVKGGSFYQFNPVVENSDASNAHSYIAEGYESSEADGWYTVTEQSDNDEGDGLPI